MPDTKDNESQQAYLERQIKERLVTFESAVVYYRKRHYRYQASTVVMAASITILSGIKLAFLPTAISAQVPLFTTDLVLILGAVSTVLAAFGAFFSPQQSWYLNAETCSKMRALQAKLEYLELSPTFNDRKEETLAGCFAEYQQLLNEHNKGWKGLRQSSK
jgi:hypothetical protein